MDRITDHPNMTSAVDHGRKALTQINKNKPALIMVLVRVNKERVERNKSKTSCTHLFLSTSFLG